MSLLTAPTGLVTLMFTDIEGSTRNWETHQERFRPILERHNALIRGALQCWNGFEVKTIGDSFMAAFADPLEAARCALQIQRQFDEEEFPLIDRLRVRIGLHTGQLEAHGNDYHGPPVNRAARIESAAHGGMILLSDITAEEIASRLPEEARLTDMGLHRLKDLGEELRLFRLLHRDEKGRSFPPLRTLSARPHNFPADVNSFIGRERELKELIALIGDHKTRLITLTGPGGIGKTRLSLQAAAEALELFPDGAWLAELSSITNPNEVPAAIALAMHVQVPGDGTAQSQLFSYLKERKALLVLDNFEHLTEAARFVSALLRSCAEVVCLVTSRHLLQLTGEVEYALSPLDLPPIDAGVSLCLDYASVRLFVERSQSSKPGFQLTDENASDVTAICKKLEGLPLAVEITASLMRGLSPRQLLPRLNDRFRLLATTRRDLEPRQRSLRGAIDYSYDLLTEEERTLFSELAVFAGGFFLEDAEAVCTVPDVFGQVFSLRDKSLLKAVTIAEETRFTMLDSLREYALEKLERSGVLEALRERHSVHFLQRAEEGAEQLTGTDPGEALRRFTLDLDNLRVGMDWAAGRDDSTRIASYGRSLAGFFRARGLYPEGNQRLLLAEESCRRVDDRQCLARILLQRGLILSHLSQFEESRRLFSESYAISLSLEDTPRLVPALLNLGRTAWYQGDFETAQSQWDEALTLARATNQTNYQSMLLVNLGILASDRGDFEGASRCFDAGLTLHEQDNDLIGIAYMLLNSSDVLRRQRKYELARQKLEESLTLFRQLEQHSESALAEVSLGVVLAEMGQVEAAEQNARSALEGARRTGETVTEMYALGLLGRCAGLRGNVLEACELTLQSITPALQIGERRHIAEALKGLGLTFHHNQMVMGACLAFAASYRELAALRLYDAAEVGETFERLSQELDSSLIREIEQRAELPLEEICILLHQYTVEHATIQDLQPERTY